MHRFKPLPVSFFRRGLALVAFCCVFASVSGQETQEPKRSYNLHRGDASTTLNQFAAASERHIIFMVAKVQGVQTNAVVGEYFPADALEQMLARTELRAVTEPGSGVFVVTRREPGSDGHLSGVGSTPQPNMKRINPLVALAAWLGLTVAPLTPSHAAENAAGSPPHDLQSTGSISGRVKNAVTGQYLNNARISVQNTNLLTFTDASGTYRLGGVPSGTAVIEVFYTGLDEQKLSVGVASNQAVEQDVDLTSVARYGATDDVVKLGTYIVATTHETDIEGIAINEQGVRPGSGFRLFRRTPFREGKPTSM